MKKLQFLLCILCVIGFATPTVYAETAEFKQSNFSQVTGGYEATLDGITVKITGSDAGMAYDPMRWYKNCVITISSECEITNIDFTASSESYATAFAAATIKDKNGSLEANRTTVTWAGNSNEIVITNSSGQTRIDSFTVTYTPAEGAVAKPVFDPAGGVVAVNTTVNVTAEETVYVASEAEAGANPTAEEVFAHGTKTNSITITADGKYYAVAVDSDDNMSSVASATFSVLQHAGTEADPYTVADAIKVANAAGSTNTTESYYVKGYVCTNPSVSNEQYTFSMTDAEDLSGDQLKAYKVTSTTAMEEGQIVVVCGPLCMYGSTPEVNTGEVTSITGKPDAEIAWSSDNFTYTIGKSEVSELPTLKNPNNVEVSYKSDNEEVATIAADGTVTINKYGTANITATFTGNTTYKAAIVTYALTVIDPFVIEDVITVDVITDFTNKYQAYDFTGSTGVKYQIYAYKSGGMQLNNSNDNYKSSGLVVKENPDNFVIKTVAITYKSTSSTTERELEVYAKADAYVSCDDAFSTGNKGDLQETYKASNTEQTFVFTPSEAINYFGLCGNTTGTILITKIVVNWERPSAFTYKNEAIGDTETHGLNVIAKDEEGNWVANGIDVSDAEFSENDGVDHYLTIDVKAAMAQHCRLINNATAWQALYLPFDIDLQGRAMLADRVIEFTGVEKVGNEVSLKFTPVADDATLLAHNLYLFIPSAESLEENENYVATMVMAENEQFDVIVKANPATDTSVSFESDGVTFTLTGNYKNLKGLKSMNAYALKDGNFMKAASDEVVLKPFRVYLTATNSDGTAWTPTSGADKIRVKVDDEATGIESVASDAIVNSEDCYNLQGIRVENPTKGLYIRNGKKFYVK